MTKLLLVLFILLVASVGLSAQQQFFLPASASTSARIGFITGGITIKL